VIKYLISLFVGMLIGAAMILALLYYNPLTKQTTLSPLSVSEHDVFTLNYSAVAADALVYTNDGESQVDPHPAKILQLWEAPIRRTTAMATVLADSRDQVVGLGIKFSSDSEKTNILNGEAIVDSVWHIYLPERGSLFVEQSENYWNYLREIVIPAYWSSGDNWRGVWIGNVTAGPGALSTARVVGGGGEFEGLESDAVEALSAKAYSVELGPVALSGELAVEIPRATPAASQDP
jgi:hypothetical protein